jgi:hypothetical protein
MRSCQKCSRPNADDRGVCLYCGSSLEGGARSTQPAPTFKIIPPDREPARPDGCLRFAKWAGITVAGLLFLLVAVGVVVSIVRGPSPEPGKPAFDVAPFCDIAAYREAFQSPYVEGKLLFVHAWSKHPDVDLALKFPPERIATKAEEVGTVIWLEWKYDKIGEYKSQTTGQKTSDAFKGLTYVAVVNQRTHEILLKKAFEGEAPPDVKLNSDSALGRMSYDDIARFILSLPRK